MKTSKSSDKQGKKEKDEDVKSREVRAVQSWEKGKTKTGKRSQNMKKQGKV